MRLTLIAVAVVLVSSSAADAARIRKPIQSPIQNGYAPLQEPIRIPNPQPLRAPSRILPPSAPSHDVPPSAPQVEPQQQRPKKSPVQSPKQKCGPFQKPWKRCFQK